MKVYVASSWRNELQPDIVRALREAGHSVYDFRNPPTRVGFGWRSVTDHPLPWSAKYTREVLSMPACDAAFASDSDGVKWADAVVMVQPSGRSAAMELGFACGAGKFTCVLLADSQEPELMFKWADRLCVSLDEVLYALGERERETHPRPEPRAMQDDVRLAMEREMVSAFHENAAPEVGDSISNSPLFDAVCGVAHRTVKVELARQRDRIAAYVRRQGMTYPGEFPPCLDRVADAIADGDADR